MCACACVRGRVTIIATVHQWVLVYMGIGNWCLSPVYRWVFVYMGIGNCFLTPCISQWVFVCVDIIGNWVLIFLANLRR